MIINVGSFFFNTNNIVTMNLEDLDNDVILRVESENVTDEVVIPEANVDEVACAIRYGMSRCVDIFDLMFILEKVRTYRGGENIADDEA